MRRPALTCVAAPIALACALFAPSIARADGLYGRFDGDLDLRAHAGVAVTKNGAALAGELALVYLQTAGLYAHYTDSLGQDAQPTARTVSAGLHLAPLFLARWAYDFERGPAHADLLLDSIALRIGALWTQRRNDEVVATPGLEVALCFFIPILPRASGPFVGVRAAARFRAIDLPGSGLDLLDRGALLSITIGWHQVLRARLSDAGDGLVREGR